MAGDDSSGWTTQTLAGHTADVLRPAGDTPPLGILLFLHPYDGLTLRQQPGWTDRLTAARLLTVCPHGPCCWWTDGLFPPFDPALSPVHWLHDQLLPALRELVADPEAPLVVAGVEMGGQGALQLAYRWPLHVPIAVAIGPKIDLETWHGYGNSLDMIFLDREAARQAGCLLQLRAAGWPRHQLVLCDAADEYCLEGTATLLSKLRSSGVPVESETGTSHGGYGWDYVNAMAGRVVDFAAERCDRVRNEYVEP